MSSELLLSFGGGQSFMFVLDDTSPGLYPGDAVRVFGRVKVSRAVSYRGSIKGVTNKVLLKVDSASPLLPGVTVVDPSKPSNSG